jgi:hypothetical protein
MFAITLFVSAFLLFLVQPMIGKLILPRLGGTPQVWNTCMVFFQAALLAGYAYTHTISTRFSLRRQLMLHGALLFLPLALLIAKALGTENHNPFSVAEFLPPPGANPIPYTLFQLLILVGLPFFVVSTSAPLLQKWFANTGHPAAKDPYFLYGASNLGSLLALQAYPFGLEPNTLLSMQGIIWAVGYALLVVLVLICAGMVWNSPPAVRLALPGGEPAPRAPIDSPPPPAFEAAGEAPPTPAPASAAAQATAIKKAPRHPGRPSPQVEPAPSPTPHFSDDLTTWRKLRWVGLGAVPTSLMLGITTHITTDLSPIPLIWLVPLTLYLLSFILVFSRWPVVWTGQPHTVFLYLHPAALALMIFVDIYGTPQHALVALVIFLSLGFFWTAMVCHGELARDRPSTRHLTEFYLWMSVGGVVGGIFNGLLAPILFPRVWEFPVALACAGLLRPTMKESGWADDLVSDFMNKPIAAPPPPKKGKHQPHQHRIAKPEDNPSFHRMLDVVLPAALLVVLLLLAFAFPGQLEKLSGGQSGLMYFFMFGVPLIICCFFYGRPLRFGLGIAAVLVVHTAYTGEGRGTIFSGRSYFGVIRVTQSAKELPTTGGGTKLHLYTQLLHGTTDHGMNFKKPADPKLAGNPLEDYSRLATTYYHRLGPAGRGMEKFNWFPGPENTYWADARMPASLIAMGAVDASYFLTVNAGSLPVALLADLWSEPPYATIGLGTGTMASYARPYQHCHFYEIDNLIRRLSLPSGGLENYFSLEKMPREGKAYFTYLQEGLRRGAQVQVLMGDARLRMDQPYKNYYEAPLLGGGPDNFYHLMVVDAFSSDAIPVHLITKQAIQMYFKKLTRDGVLCVHTSNRHVDLVKVVADVTDSIKFFEDGPHKRIVYSDSRDPEDRKIIERQGSSAEMKLVCKRGHDQAPGGREAGHYTSEWVMVARDSKYLEHLTAPPGYQEKLDAEAQRIRIANEPYWTDPTPSLTGRFVWTDDYSNLIAVLR